jgi:hypothetical protein
MKELKMANYSNLSKQVTVATSGYFVFNFRFHNLSVNFYAYRALILLFLTEPSSATSRSQPEITPVEYPPQEKIG